MKKTIIPFGPQHPVLPEPLLLDLVLEDEKIIDAIPSIGFVHRGLELLVQKKEFTEFLYVAERICGICSFIHGMGYCQAIEQIMKIETPRRAQYLRVLWSEFSRVQSHLLWLGLAADAFGFENLFMQTWRIRETVLNFFEETTGGRMIFSVCKIGGVKRDISPEMLNRTLRQLKDLQRDIQEVTHVFLNDSTILHRLSGLGCLSGPDAYRLGAVGPMLRASGVALDTRKLGYAAYNDLEFEIITEHDGDCLARCAVRIRELFQSLDLIRQIIQKMPDGPVDTKVTGTPQGEALVRLEQPRGEVTYFLRGNGTRLLDRYHARTPTFANLPAMIQILKGSELADVPTIILTIDPCVSCTER